MYSACYDFMSSHKNILSFKAGEKFVKLDAKDGAKGGENEQSTPGWVYVINENLVNGFVPETYIQLEDESMAAVKPFVTQLLKKVRNLSQENEIEQEKSRFIRIEAYLKNLVGSNDLSVEGYDGLLKQGIDSAQHTTTATNPSSPTTNNVHHTDLTLQRDQIDSETTSDLIGCELIEYVKRKTGLGHKQTLHSVESTLEFLITKVPHIEEAVRAILSSVKDSDPTGKTLEGTHDWQRLHCIFSTILDVVSNVEQLNWALYEDQHIIKEFLEELVTLLTDGDPVVCKKYLEKDQYRKLETVVQYFSMEVRPAISNLLLKVFAALCTLDRTCIKVLAYSNLPLLLARDIKDAGNDYQKLVYSCLVLTMLLWTGETLPVNHYDKLDVDFVKSVLDIMDGDLPDDNADQICDRCTELLLAYNLQFQECTNNFILKALKSKSSVKEFFGKLLGLVNREEDPVGSMFTHLPPPPNSLHKMLIDIFSEQDTANLFYTNDLKVFIEIIARKLLDLPPDDLNQAAYLQMTYNVICNTDYAEHAHCQEEFQKCFSKMLQEEVGSPKENQVIVGSICERHPMLFHY